MTTTRQGDPREGDRPEDRTTGKQSDVCQRIRMPRPRPGDAAVRQLADELRRRREAARRLPPLPSGYRDPMGPRSDGAA